MTANSTGDDLVTGKHMFLWFTAISKFILCMRRIWIFVVVLLLLLYSKCNLQFITKQIYSQFSRCRNRTVDLICVKYIIIIMYFQRDNWKKKHTHTHNLRRK